MRASMTDSFPRQYARTQRFTLGAPRNIAVSPDGRRVTFLRSEHGEDPVNSLWVLDVTSGQEHRVADPRALTAASDDPAADNDEVELPPEERARRERAREGAGGITAYATDAACTVAAFALAGRLFVAGFVTMQAREVVVAGPVFDPRPDPLATRIAYVSGNELRVAELTGRSHAIAGSDVEVDVTWGSADFIAAEEMDRFRGYWWSPDGTAIAATRVDASAVTEWVIADPAHPERPVNTIRYPAAGTTNADVSLHIVGLDGSRLEVQWDRVEFPYLAKVDWTDTGLVVLVQSRDQRSTMTLLVDTSTGDTTVLGDDDDPNWIDLVPGAPKLLTGGRLLTVGERDGSRRILIDGEAVTAPDLHVRGVSAANDGGIWFQANPVDDATVLQVWRLDADGNVELVAGSQGISQAVVGGSTTVITSTTLERAGAETSVLGGPTIASHAAAPLVVANIALVRSDANGIDVAVLLPHDHDGSPLPVLMDPYGGPHALRVVRSANAFATSQWFADQGFAVIVADGRGTPGRGSAWERAVHLDLATAPLDDQIEALHAAAERFEEVDLSRVAIRGWSFGGFLAALAVLRRPDVFHAAIAGAPVTEWRLYDTHYTERYLGDPNEQPDVYDANSLLPLAADLTRPLLLVHGLADDNVVAAHTLQLSTALLAAGRPHEVLPLSGVTHMTPQEVVAENLLLHQLEFLRRSLPTPRDIPED